MDFFFVFLFVFKEQSIHIVYIDWKQIVQLIVHCHHLGSFELFVIADHNMDNQKHSQILC